MTDNHPITPPPELFKQWEGLPRSLAFEAAYRAGADQELEACCMWLSREVCDGWGLRQQLRVARRPKSLSPKEEALQVLEALIESRRIVDPEYQALRHALEQLND